MNASLAERPRYAAMTAALIVIAVAISAMLFPHDRSSGGTLPSIPTYGPEEAYGRIFVAIDATEQGKPHQFYWDAPSFTFSFGEWVEISTGCNHISARWKLAGDRLELSDAGTSMTACSDSDPYVDDWMSEFLDHRPWWRLEDNALELTSDFGTMTLVDRGEGRERENLLDREFVSTAIWEQPDDLDSARFAPHVWPRLSITRDRRIRASFGCRTLEADAKIAAGSLVITDDVSPRTQPCSRSVEAHETDWFWDFLRQPLRWQLIENGLRLASDSTTLTFEAVGDGMYRDDPEVLRDKTLRSTSMDGGGHKKVGIVKGKGATLTIDSGGNLTAGIGCDEPTIHAKVREGWLEYQPSNITRGDCPNLAAEEWLDDFFADEPSWHLSRGGLFLISPRTRMQLIVGGPGVSGAN